MSKKIVRNWLYIITFLCLMIVMVGGITRLTGSGLSITEWHPINGIIPPLTTSNWMAEFQKYKQIEQYHVLNSNISLHNFKFLYLWEWSHRFFARIIGIIAIFPLLWSIKNALCDKNKNLTFLQKLHATKYIKYFILIPLMIGLQGVIGWWMVYSGLAGSKLTSVSQYRLATHMISASLIIMVTTYWSRNLIDYKNIAAPLIIQKFAGIFSFAILLQIYFGALVAGLHAGLSYNSWPLIDGKFIPYNLFTLKPWWHNLFENILTVQFVHRCFGYIVFLLALFNVVFTIKICKFNVHSYRSIILFVMVLAQIILGVSTLLFYVPVGLAVIHQFFALMLLVFSVMHWRATKGNI